MSDIIVATDADARMTVSAKEIAETIGPILALTYPGYRWRVEPHPHPTKPFVAIRLEHATACEVRVDKYGEVRRRHAPLAQIIKTWQFYSASSLKAEVIRCGGELLEAFKMNRRAFDPAEFLTLPRDRVSGLLVLPTL